MKSLYTADNERLTAYGRDIEMEFYRVMKPLFVKYKKDIKANEIGKVVDSITSELVIDCFEGHI